MIVRQISKVVILAQTIRVVSNFHPLMRLHGVLFISS